MTIELKSAIAAMLLGVVGMPAFTQTSDVTKSADSPKSANRTPNANCSDSAPPPPTFSLFFDPNGVWQPYQIASPCLPSALTDALDALGVARYKPLSSTAVNSIQYEATGSFTPPGSKPLTLTQSRMQIGYAIPAFRFDYEAGGRRHIAVWSYKYAWDETTPGTGAKAAMNQVDSRVPLIWLTPQGALWAGVYADRKVKVSTSGGKTTLTAPVAQLGIVSITTLGADHLPEKTTLKYKGNTYEAAFADYQPDKPNYLNKFPAKIVWKVNGKELANFTITSFRANPYVVFPVPENVRQAANHGVSSENYVYAPAFLASAAQGFNATIKPEGETPHTKGGKVDFTGYWNKGEIPSLSLDFAHTLLLPGQPVFQFRNNKQANVIPDRTMLARGRLNKPIYKPEYWSKVQALDFGKVYDDPYFNGKPLGTPRNGPPSFIAMNDDWMMVKYYNLDSVRIIPLHGGQHPQDDIDYGNTFNGISIGQWDGDTLIVDSVGYNDISWLYWTGYLHSANMHVVEKFRRVGNVLYYDATVYDDMLAVPWVLDTQVRRLNPDKVELPHEFPPWVERDKNVMDPDYRG